MHAQYYVVESFLNLWQAYISASLAKASSFNYLFVKKKKKKKSFTYLEFQSELISKKQK
jgi:hypothetical protein